MLLSQAAARRDQKARLASITLFYYSTKPGSRRSRPDLEPRGKHLAAWLSLDSLHSSRLRHTHLSLVHVIPGLTWNPWVSASQPVLVESLCSSWPLHTEFNLVHFDWP